MRRRWLSLVGAVAIVCGAAGLIGVVQIGLIVIGQTIKALALGFEHAPESRSAWHSEFVHIENLAGQMDRFTPPALPAGHFPEVYGVPAGGVAVRVGEYLLLPRRKADNSKIGVLFNAPVQEKPLGTLIDDFERDVAVGYRPSGFAYVGETEESINLLARNNASDKRLSENNFRAMGSKKLHAADFMLLLKNIGLAGGEGKLSFGEVAGLLNEAYLSLGRGPQFLSRAPQDASENRDSDPRKASHKAVMVIKETKPPQGYGRYDVPIFAGLYIAILIFAAYCGVVWADHRYDRVIDRERRHQREDRN